MKTKKWLFIIGASINAMSGISYSMIINPSIGDPNVTRWEGLENSVPEIEEKINEILNNINGSTDYNASEHRLYKIEYDQKLEDGSLQFFDHYNTYFIDDSSGTITHDPGEPYIAPDAYMLVKDGKQTPAWYFYDLTSLGWNGTDDVEFNGFWSGDNKGGISHVTIYGCPQNNVPESGSTVIMLGSAFMATAGLKFLFNRKSS